MKDKSITIRLSQEEYHLLDYYKSKYNMNNTQAIRSLLKNNIPKNEYQQRIASAICQIYIRLTDLGLEDDALTEEVQKLCQMLS